MTQDAFNAVLDACFGLPTGVEADGIMMPDGRSRGFEVHLADRIPGRHEVTDAADPAQASLG
jgi:hypothetical protein